ncbi:MAG: rRNA pseudouridine synthase [Cytophagales bacterium]|nr:rRNA pseudouridine synthase [Cytophagales bacterium]
MKKPEKPGNDNKAPYQPFKKKESEDFKKAPKSYPAPAQAAEVRLNKFLADCGVSSRREADKLINQGRVTVNGKMVDQLGTKINPQDQVSLDGKPLTRQNFVYVLLNKPKDFLCTLDDPEGRRTVMDLVAGAASERIYPVGRLDRNTTGLLLLTNDGELTKRLTHPSYEVKKIYQVDLNKSLSEEHFELIKRGVVLEDGPVQVDDIAILSKDQSIVGVEIHVGRNRIVRRIFEHCGYDVIRLDRVLYAGLTKKNLTRGSWRYLTAKEVIDLKHLGRGQNQSKKK